jgi:hypothetical protein
MCLQFVFLLVTRLAAWSWLCRREESQKNAEIRLLCHELAVLRRRPGGRPKPSWADRAPIAALLEVIPHARRASLRMIVPPPENGAALALRHRSPALGSQVPTQTARAPTLIAIERSTSRVHLAGVTANPDGRVDDTGGAQLPDGPRRTGDSSQVPDQRSLRPVHPLLRRVVNESSPPVDPCSPSCAGH